MVLIDTTVWIDLFNNKNTKEVFLLKGLIDKDDDICLCGIIYAEVLQGIRDEGEFKKVQSILNRLIYLPIQKHTFDKAITIYRTLRKRGITVRGTIDCIIASVCMEHEIRLLQRDKDFHRIAEAFPLKILK